jgi:hypothetical protein
VYRPSMVGRTRTVAPLLALALGVVGCAGPAMSARRLPTARVPARTVSVDHANSRAVHFPEVGVTLTPATDGAQPRVRRDQAVRIFRSHGMDRNRPRRVQLVEYQQGWGTSKLSPPILAWSVTVRHAPARSYGPVALPSGTTGTLHVLINALSGRILTIFEV